MAYIVIDNFSYGLDRRRSRFAGVPGSLWRIENAHITRGGEIERCKRFVKKYTLPSGTFSCFGLGASLYVFGSAATPVDLPAGVTYQRLQHPDLLTAMTAVLDVKAMDGAPYVAARFADGSVRHFYNGALVTDWNAGVVASYMASNSGVASYFRDLINADPALDWTATSAGNVLVVTGSDNTDWTYTASSENGGAIDDQLITVSVAQTAVTGTNETLSSASFSITGGLAATAATGSITLTGGAAGSINTLTVDGVDIIGSAVPYNTSLNQTAADLAARINTYSSSPEYTATAVGAVVTISAAVLAGASPNGFVVAFTATTLTATTANMSGGVDRGISSIKVDGIEILGSTINLVGSYSSLASAVASAITSFTSSPEYTGSANVQTVTIYAAAGTGSAPNGKAVAITTAGDVTTSVTSAAMAGGVAATAGQPKVVNFAFGGTFEAGDKHTLKLVKELRTKVFGYGGSPTPVGEILLPHKTKMHAAKDSLVNFSAANAATIWNRDNVDTVVAGQGFINAASQDEGSQAITGLTLYHGELGILSRNSIQLWAINADPSVNTFLQTLPNTGTRAGKSVLTFANNDSFYLDDTGVRSLRARDASNSAYVNDVGTAIDTLIQEDMRNLTEDQITNAVATLDPTDGRYWLAMGTKIYVFSFFPGSKISAWSTYLPGFEITDFARVENNLYARSGDDIYLYGGDTGVEYPLDDEMPVYIETPYMSGDKPCTFKAFIGFDIGCRNEWDCYLMHDMNNEAVENHIGVFNRPTYSRKRNKVSVDTTHVALKMSCNRGGYALLANAAVHFDDPHDAG